MAAVSVYKPPVGGFSFDNCRRNAVLEADFAKKGYKLPAARKTGTTIAGVVYKDGIVLGADTRATEGMVVADKNCSKIHFISPNIYCCGAGTAADTDMTTQLISSNLELHSLSTGRLPRVVTANRMLKQMLFRYQGYIGAALVLGGVDVTGPHLYSIYPHGSTDKLPYVTMGDGELDFERDPQNCQYLVGFVLIYLIYFGRATTSQTAGSGSLAAMAVFEDKFRPDMEEEEAKTLVSEAIAAGIFNDLGSGSNIDLCVINKSKLDFLRPFSVPNKKGTRFGRYRCEKGTTAVLTEKVTSLEIEVLEETVQTMDTS
ncbi:Proteasome subunit beta type-7 [Pteropus alecto]|uniref:Proteasome subunit beta n=1 Tax=Pteropus alecto TaxID=9402 RepID=L5K647_PTEAL|nr:Proteasome subunit beta type-7 [Pteropus alecto]